MYTGKHVLITGSSKGIGLLLLNHFLANSAKVIGFSRNDFVHQSADYEHFKVDIGDAKQVSAVFKQIAKKYGHIDILINNAAVLTSQYAMIMPAGNAEKMVQTNILGTFNVTREAVKLMRKNAYGRVINIGSMAEKLEPIGDSVYAASKSAMRTMINSMAKELASFHITCNTVGITAIETDMLNQLPREKVDPIIKQLTIPRYAAPADIFNAVDFFASADSSYITAQTIYLGGIN
ncbi:MAG: SDR family oxidoreductase [Ignavibacteriales bacterium]|nr:SDR family oxidoreductase [Ignavibacteriales bacterium]